jgi:hypothetical protein
MQKLQLDTKLLTLNERIDIAAEHLAWVRSRQPQGMFVIRAFAPQPGSQGLKLVSTEYLDSPLANIPPLNEWPPPKRHCDQ